MPHELLLYEDTTHYLDAYNPTPGTHLVYERVLQYVAGAAKRLLQVVTRSPAQDAIFEILRFREISCLEYNRDGAH